VPKKQFLPGYCRCEHGTCTAQNLWTVDLHRYELHHGVRISDSALVEAAELSNRYIADRFLPDKAIDIIDESAAKLKMEITSKPLALDEIDRKVCGCMASDGKCCWAPSGGLRLP
jgi:AAA lid domain